MFYTNRSAITKTFHGVTFKPGETKEVFGVINDPKMAISSVRQEPPKRGRRPSVKIETEDVIKKSDMKAKEATVAEDASKEFVESQYLEQSEIVENKEV